MINSQSLLASDLELKDQLSPLDLNLPRQSSELHSPDKKNSIFLSLKENTFLNEFKLICDKTVPDWKKYTALYKRIGTNLCINHNAKLPDANIKKDAFLCLKLLADVLIVE